MGWILNTKTSKTFKVLDVSEEPVIEFIPNDDHMRGELYAKYLEQNIIIPDYNRFTAPDLEKVDMMLLTEDWFCVVRHVGKYYKLHVKKGCCWDGASIPLTIEYGRLSKVSQYCLTASLAHDLLYAQGYFPAQLCNDWFEGLLKFKKLNRFTRWLYVAGVRVFGPKRYEECRKIKDSWTNGFVTLTEIDPVL